MNSVILVLAILLPVVGGFLMIPMRLQEDRARCIYSNFIVILTSVLVWCILIFADAAPMRLYRITGYFSLAFGVDGLSRVFAFMISVMWPLVMLYAYSYMSHEQRKNGFFAFYVMTYGITLGVAFSANITTLYVFFEMLSLVTIPLVMHYGDHESMYAARKYAAYTIGGAAFAFFSVIMSVVFGYEFFVFGGSEGMGLHNHELFVLAYLFGFFGFGVKAAVFPFHDWLPTASAAPTPVTALLHAVAVVNSGVFAVIRLTWYTVGPEMLRDTWVQTFCLAVCCFTLVWSAVMAIKERHFKKRMAYSTVSNLSYMLFGVLLLTPQGLVGGVTHMVCHGVIKMSLFLCAGAFMHVTGKKYIYEINGVGKQMPVTFTCYTLGALSLTGIPLFAGFVSKWQLLLGGLYAYKNEGNVMGLVGCVCLIAAAFLCAMYTLSVSIRAFFPTQGTDRYPAKPGVSPYKDADKLMLAPIVVFTVINIGLGVWSGPMLDFISRIAHGLI